MQEMLNLIIQIVKERRFCGLTTAQCLQRELIYKLSTGNATHSQLVKSLPRDLSKVDEFQQILDTVADYSHPSGIKQVVFFNNGQCLDTVSCNYYNIIICFRGCTNYV